MRFAVLADANIGRSIPFAIAKHKREAFSLAFSKTVDIIVGMLLRRIFDAKFRKEPWARLSSSLSRKIIGSRHPQAR